MNVAVHGKNERNCSSVWNYHLVDEESTGGMITAGKYPLNEQGIQVF
jgi:hypothetical protein